MMKSGALEDVLHLPNPAGGYIRKQATWCLYGRMAVRPCASRQATVDMCGSCELMCDTTLQRRLSFPPLICSFFASAHQQNRTATP